MKAAGLALRGVVAAATLLAGALHAEGPQPSLDPVRLQQQIRLMSADGPRAGAQRELRDQTGVVPAVERGTLDAVAPAATPQSRQREQARLRLEQRLNARSAAPGGAAAGAGAPARSTRFGVGYEARMRARQGVGVAGSAGLAGGGRGGGGR